MFLFYLAPISMHIHPLQVENCDNISKLVVGEDDNGKFRFERVNHFPANRDFNRFYSFFISRLNQLLGMK